MPWYSRQAVAAELGAARDTLPGETPPTLNLPIALPSDDYKGWLGLAWLLVAMIRPPLVGSLTASLNSLLTKR